MQRAEFGVIGTGTLGAMALWHLARSGREVVGFEQHWPGHQRGAAAGDTRWVRTASEEAGCVPLMQRAIPLWRELEEETGQRLLDLCGGLYVGRADSSFIRGVAQNCQEFSLAHEVLTAGEMRRRFTQFAVVDDEVGIFEEAAGQVHASLAVAAAAGAAQRRGARLLSRTRVEAVDLTADGVVVRAAGEDWCFDKVLMATGPWGRDLLPDHIPHLEVERFLVSWYPLAPAHERGSAREPILERQGAEHIFGSWPSVDGLTAKVGFAAPVDRLAHAADMHQEIAASVVELTDAYVRRWLPGLLPHSVRHAVGMDAHVSDRGFLLGPSGRDPRVVLALGMAGHGFKMSPATGSAAADYLMHGESHADLAAYLPERFPVLPFLDYRV
ncbi:MULTISPECIES: N-methyl-L-tryptophan oxidase [Brevibacterium]|uniref:N-methyl-L-tryptophan oxidase n=1 Tax=Brevibacterium salitolerans TaxID=1403566 RepID=A0ABN2X799_9MICO|nr:N-methyl-L-tryptophan oxidase [Brevibacterium sp.]